MPNQTTRIRHGRIELALHSRRGGDGPGLLLLHALHDSSRPHLDAIAWTGPVHALDFAGHGESDWLRGGGYTPELFAADADCALASLGDAARGICIAGAGIGAYAALLLAGARPDQVAAVLLMPGDGLGRGDGEPDFERRPRRWPPLDAADRAGRADRCDPALARLNDQFKPHDYVQSFVERTRRIYLLEDPKLPAGDLPGWWRLAARSPVAQAAGPTIADALARMRGHAALDG